MFLLYFWGFSLFFLFFLFVLIFCFFLLLLLVFFLFIVVVLVWTVSVVALFVLHRLLLLLLLVVVVVVVKALPFSYYYYYLVHCCYYTIYTWTLLLPLILLLLWQTVSWLPCGQFYIWMKPYSPLSSLWFILTYIVGRWQKSFEPFTRPTDISITSLRMCDKCADRKVPEAIHASLHRLTSVRRLTAHVPFFTTLRSHKETSYALLGSHHKLNITSNRYVCFVQTHSSFK